MARPRWFVAALLMAAAQDPGCTDPGIIGEIGPCEPGCAAGEICDAERGRCAICVEDEDCAGREEGAYCESSACVACRSNVDCGADAGAVCSAGRCLECATDDDCGEERSCEQNRCVDGDDLGEDQDDDSQEEDGEAGEAGDDSP